MKLRRSALITLFLLTAVFVVASATYGYWQPFLLAQFDTIAANASLLQGIAAILAIGSALLAGLRILLLSRQREQALASEPILPTTVDGLRKRFGRGGQVNWIDRQITHPDLLVSHRRVVITGRMKLGKTREAMELIRRAIAHDLVPSDRVYVPGPTLPFLNPDTLRDLLRRTVDPQAPLLLFVDDLPYHYHDSTLEQLATALTALGHTKATYIVATARDDQLTPGHDAWFYQHGFHTLSLSALDQAQTTRLVDSAAGTFNLQVDEDARAAFVAAGDGTPELVLINFRRLDADGFTQVDQAMAQQTARYSIGEAWAAARADILKRHPEADHIFSALAGFYTAGVTPYTALMLAFAAHLWRRQPRPAPPWHRYRLRPLRQTLAYLAHFDVVVQQDQVSYPDFVAEEQPERDAVALELEPFLLRYHRLFYRALLRHFYPYAESHMWALFDMASGAGARKEYGRAVRLYSAALDIHSHFGVYNNRGLAYSDQGDLAAAIADFSKAIALDSDLAAAYYNRGLAYSDQGDLAAAIADFSKAIALDPDFPAAYYNRGNVYSDQGNLAAAIADFSKAIALDPDFAAAYNNRGNIYRTQGDLAAAIADYTQAIILDRDNAVAYYNRGTAYGTQGDLAVAIADFSKAIALDPDFAAAYNNRGNTYRDQGELAAAITDYTQAIALNPDDAAAYHNRGLAYHNQGELAAAIADFSKAIALDPDLAAAYYSRGKVYLDQGDLATAITDFSKAIALNPDYAAAHNNRGIAYRQLNQLDDAMAGFNRALELAPDDDWYLYSRGLTWLVQDRSEPAAADLNRAIDVARQKYDENPQDWRNTLNLALYHLAAGNAASAEQLYNEALTAPPNYFRGAIQDLDDFLHFFPEHGQALRVQALLQDRLDT